jgi:tetratricopeptide (TPR) repeat protein
MDRALHTITGALQYTPGEPSLLNLKAHVLTRKGELQEPMEIYKGLTSLDPKSYIHWFNYGAVLSRLGKYGEAETALKRAITIDVKIPNAYKELAFLYEKNVSKDQAAANFEKGLKDFQNNSESFRNLFTLYLEHFPEKTDRAITLARQALEHAPGDPNIMDALGTAYYKKGDLNKAVASFKQALSVRPDDPFFLFHAGVVSIKAGDAERGKAYLKELVQKYPDHELTKQVNTMAGGK